jgi:GntR family transcriptional regulator/MocR family aminotransferase
MARRKLTLHLDPESETPRYLQIARGIIRSIRRGLFKPGDALPGTRALADQLNVSRSTALAAYRELESEGWVVSQPDQGTRVSERPPSPATSLLTHTSEVLTGAPPVPGQDRLGFPLRGLHTRGEGAMPARGALRLVPGLPDVRLLDLEALGRAHRRVLRLNPQRILRGEGPAQGSSVLRERLAQLLQELRGLAVHPDQILLTAHLSGAVDLALRALVAPGEAVAVEDPGPPELRDAALLAGLEVFPLPVDEHGLRVAEVATLLGEQALGALALTAAPQIPTRVPLSQLRRRQLLELAQAQGLPILELDPELGFQGQGPGALPLAAQDAHGNVVLAASLGQSLAPALQVGFLVGPRPFIRLAAELRAPGEGAAQAYQEALLEAWFSEGEFHRHLRKARQALGEREAALRAALVGLGPGFQISRAGGGTALWLQVPPGLRVEDWAERCLDHGVVIQPGRSYDASRRAVPAVALGFAACEPEELREAVRRMAMALGEIGYRA